MICRARFTIIRLTFDADAGFNGVARPLHGACARGGPQGIKTWGN